MRHPFWIVNSTLFFIAVFAFWFVRSLSHRQIPERQDIEPLRHSYVTHEKKVDININKIYENDLFGTYKKELPAAVGTITGAQLPALPQPTPITIPKMPQPTFLEPLDITLKGIVALSSTSNKNSAIIQENKSKREAIFKAGDTIEDAQIVRIFSNKVLFLRSSGQQELLYLRELDAKNDPTYLLTAGWKDVVLKKDEYNAEIVIEPFLERVTSLASFLELFSLTTAYQKGKSVGSRVGVIDATSLPAALGFNTGDVIIAINDIPATDTKNRLKIYKMVTSFDENEIVVHFVRKNSPRMLHITLKHQEYYPAPQPTPLTKMSKEEKEKILKDNYTIAPTVQEIRLKERNNMLRGGTAPASQTIGK